MVYRPCDLYESDSSPVILIIKRIIQLGQAMIKITFSLLFIDILFLDSLMISQLSLITLQNWSSKKNYKKEFD